MSPNRMIGLALAGLFAIAATGCASMPEQQAYNRDAHANVKTIAVLETQPTRTTVMMLNHPGASFGLIGGLVAAADQSSKQGKYDAILEKTQFQPLPYFRERLTAHMAGRGYTLVWPASQVQAGKVDRGSFGLRKAYAPTQAADAQMDVNFGFVGYAAAGAGDGSPYRPTATMAVRLVAPDGKQNYYTDYYAYNNVFNIKKAVVIDGDPKYVYPGFDDLEKAGVDSVEGLRLAIDALAARIAGQL